jgi:alkylation response protein AidB-like acyl-CoA dehydrogenase
MAALGVHAAERLHLHGNGAHRRVLRDLLRSAHRPLRRFNLSVWRRGAKAKVAASDDALGEDRLLLADRARRRFGHFGRPDHHRAPGGGRLDIEGPEEAYCTVKCRETVGYPRELLDGNGILLDEHIGRFVADAEAIYSYEGTREVNTLIVGKAITGLSAFV